MNSQRLGYSMHGRIKASGFSLIELMISIAIGLLILAGMLVVFANTNASRNEIDRTNRQIENGRYALELLRDDLQLAGFYGEMNWGNFVATAALPASMPDPCATTLTERTSPAGGTQSVLRLHVQGVDNYVAGGLSCSTTGLNAVNVKPGTDVIVVRRAKTCIAPTYVIPAIYAGIWKHCPADEVTTNYLQISLCSTLATTTHILAPVSETFSLKLKDCTTDAPKIPYVIYMYFVSDPASEPDKTPKLKRAEFTGAAMGNVVSLVDGIENMQVEYGVDTNNDGNADSYQGYLGDPTLAATVTKWSNVVTVKLHLLARNTESSPGYPGTAAKTYQVGPVTFVPSSTVLIGPKNEREDSFRRHVYTSLVRIQNVSARRETP